ncbi:MAG: NupC/NupG family nucleoside CNT transporter [Gemmatimonadota bacterium]|nr:NupC/NupG family nucleoside CNT transporter [Gemmatimonadota bacterium]
MAFLLGCAWAFSARRRAIDWGLVGKGLALQVVFALLVLRTEIGRGFFSTVNDAFLALIDATNQGARFLFGALIGPTTPAIAGDQAVGVVPLYANLAFSVLPTIVFFSALTALAYHLGVMQRIVGAVAWLMQRTLRTSGAETTSAAGNIFIGMTEAPLLVRPFIGDLTTSELNTVMTGGFATVAGGVMAAYVAMLVGFFPDVAGHLLAASIMAAPAGIVMSKMLFPESDQPQTAGTSAIEVDTRYANVIDAAASGAGDGLKLALNVAAMLLAFLALIAMANGVLGWSTGLLGFEGLTLERLFGWVFAPVAWLIGVPWADAAQVGSLFGIKIVANEFVAFQTLATGLADGLELSPQALVITTYAMTGFASFGAIAIEIGGIGGIAPSRRADLARLGIRAMAGGMGATCMTATLAGVLA